MSFEDDYEENLFRITNKKKDYDELVVLLANSEFSFADVTLDFISKQKVREALNYYEEQWRLGFVLSPNELRVRLGL